MAQTDLSKLGRISYINKSRCEIFNTILSIIHVKQIAPFFLLFMLSCISQCLNRRWQLHCKDFFLFCVIAIAKEFLPKPELGDNISAKVQRTQTRAFFKGFMTEGDPAIMSRPLRGQKLMAVKTIPQKPPP